MRVYIAGPYTNGDQAENVAVAVDMADMLLFHGLTPFVPHLTHFWQMMHPHTWEKWMEYDLQWLEVCDALLRLPGVSKGADMEEARARELGIPVFYKRGELVLWAKEKERGRTTGEV